MARWSDDSFTRALGVLGGTAALGLIAGCGAAATGPGANYPSGPVTITAPADPGSGWDTTARAIVQTLEQEDLSDSPLPVQNRPGGDGCAWMTQMVESHAGADDQIAMTSMATQSNEARGLCAYSVDDVTMLSTLIVEHYIIVTAADSEYETLDDLLDAMNSDPGGVPIGAGGDDQLPLALTVMESGGDPSAINFVSYEGGGAQNTALLNGDIAVAVAGVSEFRAQIEAGELRALGTMAEEPLEAPLDDVPLVTDLGYDVTIANWRGVYGPPEMPQEAVDYWQAKLHELTETETWQQLVAQNQWGELVLGGDEMLEYITEAGELVDLGVQETAGDQG
ncbi:Bug family tripartite tricarboxylate transporter substrate binding protein [Sediminivirga luteola]|nr:tripartite tricarboxylate transporter substrate-binding protein [Sediminivirga luteola]MCI2265145.1 tripartite tricarboxylate transporter substrate binding protein [Sediminivirga luteola]